MISSSLSLSPLHFWFLFVFFTFADFITRSIDDSFIGSAHDSMTITVISLLLQAPYKWRQFTSRYDDAVFLPRNWKNKSENRSKNKMAERMCNGCTDADARRCAATKHALFTLKIHIVSREIAFSSLSWNDATFSNWLNCSRRDEGRDKRTMHLIYDINCDDLFVFNSQAS